jgi:hypothetical protein
MKRSQGSRSLLLWSVFALGSVLPAMSGRAQESVPPAAASSNITRARQLATDVREMATAPGVSRAKREKRIATAVRTAVVAATAYRPEAAAALGAATELAVAATRAAPAYAEVIIKAASLAPGVTRIDGAAGAIRAAALAGGRPGSAPVAAMSARGPAAQKRAAPAPRRSEPVEMEPDAAQLAADDAARQPADTRPGAANRSAGEEDMSALPGPVRRGRHPVNDPGMAFTLKLDTAVRYDDNVFLTSANTVHDVIIALTPGLGLRWGDKSRSHGELGYGQSFEHYVDHTAPNVSLGNGAFDFTFDGASASGSAKAGYQQLYQSNSDLAATGQSALLRTNVTSAGANLQVNPWAKIGARLGVSYADTSYNYPGLIGNRQIGVPFDVLFNLTPKLDLSAGYAFSTQRPDGGGDSSKDHYFNVGARGSFTPKLTGGFNIGYQTRRVGARPDDHMLAFSGNFGYELTPRTSLSLAATRNFNASALGATTRNTQFRLGLASNLSPQLNLGASLAWNDNEYGLGVFRSDQVQPLERTDHLWEGGLNASYLFTEWFSTSATYSLRHTASTIPGVGFSQNVLSLTLGLKY